MAEATSEPDTFFFPRLSCKEINSAVSSTTYAAGDGSFRVLYYGGAGSVPFTWESRPGTPKQSSEERPSAPPLTPPPSYQLNQRSSSRPSRKKGPHPTGGSKICKYSIFSRNGASKKSDVVVPTFSPSSSQSSSPYSPPRARPLSAEVGTPSSMLCFGPRSSGDSRMFRDYYVPIKHVKKMVMSIVGHAKNN